MKRISFNHLTDKYNLLSLNTVRIFKIVDLLLKTAIKYPKYIRYYIKKK